MPGAGLQCLLLRLLPALSFSLNGSTVHPPLQVFPFRTFSCDRCHNRVDEGPYTASYGMAGPIETPQTPQDSTRRIPDRFARMVTLRALHASIQWTGAGVVVLFGMGRRQSEHRLPVLIIPLDRDALA